MPMPKPKPRETESKEDFISRFMSDPVMIEDYPKESQRIAVAETEWDNSNKSVKVGDKIKNSKITCDIKQFGNEEDRVLRFIVTDESQDSDEDILLFEGWNLQRFVKNPVGLYMHQYDKPAMAKAINIIKDEMSRTIKIDFKFPSFDEMSSDERFVSDWAKLTDTVFNLYKNGYMNAVSVGFDSNDYTKNPNSQFGRIYKNKSMLEVSFVSVPANENALLTAKSKGIIDEEGVEAMKKYEKRASGKTDLPLADRDILWDATNADKKVRSWSGGPSKEDIDWNKYKDAFFWQDETDTEGFGGYKLGFADIVNGKLTAIPRGIFASAAAIQGARGGVDIPEADIEPVKRKIETYYKRMDLTAPWEKSSKSKDVYEDELKLKTIKAGNTLNLKNRENLANIINMLSSALSIANNMMENYLEPSEVPSEKPSEEPYIETLKVFDIEEVESIKDKILEDKKEVFTIDGLIII